MTKYPQLTIQTGPIQTIPKDRIIQIQNFQSVKDMEGKILATRREFSEFAMKAIWLDDEYDWALGRDSKGALLLVPMKKS